MTTMPEPAAVGHALRQGSLLRRVHRLSALPLAAYALPHLANHLLAVRGIERHIAFMRVMRQVVRVPAVEVLLLACVACQIVTGLVMVFRRRRTGGGWLSRAQAQAGLIVGLVLAVVIVATFSGALYPVEIPPAYLATLRPPLP